MLNTRRETMNPYNVTGPSNSQVAQVESIVSQRLKGSFLWMVVGLLTTIGVGFAALANPNWLRFAYQNFYLISRDWRYCPI
jgi:hypothetical protein